VFCSIPCAPCGATANRFYRSGFPKHQAATSGHSHVWLAQEPFLLFPSVNRRLTADAGSAVATSEIRGRGTFGEKLTLPGSVAGLRGNVDILGVVLRKLPVTTFWIP